MPTSYTSLLGFALPVTGEINGTWGDVVNDSITQLVEDSVAGTATASVASGDWTLTTTGSGAANQARCAILIPTGSPGTTRNIIAPSSSKAYIVDNQSDSDVVLKGSATTGVSIAAGSKALCAWNGTDFVQVGGGGGGGVYDTQTFTSSGTWTKPSGASQVRVIAIGGGGGGGSGRKGAAGTARTGGSGGFGGCRSDITIPASILASTISVTIGLGGSGGASQTTNSTNGNNGTIGGNTTFGATVTAYGGFAGAGGDVSGVCSVAAAVPHTDLSILPGFNSNGAVGPVYGVSGSGICKIFLLSSSSTSGSSPGAPGLYGPGSGASGGALTNANVLAGGTTIIPVGNTAGYASLTIGMGYGGTGALLFGGFAGGTASVTDGSTGGNGTATTTGQPYGGGGGGGGQASLTGNAGAGGNGALYGGGGGGGGASVDSVGNSGAGGNGASGICVVISW